MLYITGHITLMQSVREIIGHLVEHGCQDLTEQLDFSTFDDYPTSHGGLSDIFHGYLSTGQRIAVKVLRISMENYENSKHLKVNKTHRIGAAHLSNRHHSESSTRALHME
jgi:hypothetical protein